MTADVQTRSVTGIARVWRVKAHVHSDTPVSFPAVPGRGRIYRAEPPLAGGFHERMCDEVQAHSIEDAAAIFAKGVGGHLIMVTGAELVADLIMTITGPAIE